LIEYPKTSIVTPSYNQGEFLEETILSVISQNYPNLEYIVIDGGSTDDSVEIIRKYEKYITYWVSEKDNGHAHALNKGFEKSTGEIMAWINSDDKYFEWTFKTISEIYSNFKEVEWTLGLYSNFDRRGVLMSGVNSVRSVYKNVFDYLFRDLHIQQESVFWRRSLWEKSGGYISEEVKLMVDTELWCRFFVHARLYHIDQVIGGYRIYGLNRSHNNDKFVKSDIEYSINSLIKNLPINFQRDYEQIIEYKVLTELYYREMNKVNYYLDNNIFLKILPHLIYAQVKNFIFKKKFKKVKPELPSSANFIYELIKKNSHQEWELKTVKYNFPY
jgi:glycosyltransferase involved in cell wall biosynthesis